MTEETNPDLDGDYPGNEHDDGPVIDSKQNRKILWQPKDYSIGELQAMKTRQDLDLQPDYQRNFVFDDWKASRLIESILLDVPIPAIYLAEEEDGRYSVIDGQQRLTSCMSFIEGKFPDGHAFKLLGLGILSEYKNLYFTDLERSVQRKILNTALHTNIIKHDSETDVKFDIFERLNTGSMRLNEDEIRNTVFRGKYIDLLRELAEKEPEFHQMVRKDNFRKRMIYRGMILRFFALSEKTYLNYKPSYKQFCNKELRDNRNMADGLQAV
ncbi:MAG: DUF262 domain-containing protein [Treponema sp.]|jgi:hypothetical protein|nr:DUF262 domain-containing protein [Treponema sp.]